MRRGVLPQDGHTHFDAFLRELQSTMPSLIQPTRELEAARLGIDVESLRWGGLSSRRFPYPVSPKDRSLAEVFILDTGLLVVKVSTPGDIAQLIERPDGSIEQVPSKTDDVLEVSAIMSSVQDATSVLDTASTIAQSTFHIELKDYFYQSERFRSLRHEVVAENFAYKDIDILAAKALAVRPARTLAIAIRTSRGLLVRDVGKAVNVNNVSELVESLVLGGVAAQDVVVVCGVSQSQVARAPNRECLVRIAEAGLRCVACGKPIDQESVEDLLTITDLGALLLDKSRWLSLLVRESLVSLGVPREDILLECQLGSDEIDCIAQVSGEVTIFELKDKEFSMGNAYSFSAKISAVRPSHSVIVTTDKVGSDVKERFSRVGPRARDFRGSLHVEETEPVEYVEGDNFESGLRRVVDRIYRSDANTILEDALLNSIPAAASVLDNIGKFDEPRGARAVTSRSRARRR
jgi:hypothetical protein